MLKARCTRDSQAVILSVWEIEEKMAGVAGFEPAHGEIKTRCLTAWLHPNNLGDYSDTTRTYVT